MKKTRWLSMTAVNACLIIAGGCATAGNGVNSSISPHPRGTGVMATVDVEFDSVSEVPGKLLKGVGDILVSVTQPIHSYHYVRADNGGIMRNSEGKPIKVWAPFWRIIGKHHGDSVVGIVYDHGWCGGWREKPGDKLGKSAGLLLLIWGGDSLLDHLADDGGNDERNTGSHVLEAEACSTADESDDYYESGPGVPNVTPPTGPTQPPAIPPVTDPNPNIGGEGTGGPVGM